jgi:hypothetical protein
MIRISTPVTVSLSVAFIAISGPCAAQVTNKPVLALDGAKQIIAAAASHARTKPEQVSLRSLMMEKS